MLYLCTFQKEEHSGLVLLEMLLVCWDRSFNRFHHCGLLTWQGKSCAKHTEHLLGCVTVIISTISTITVSITSTITIVIVNVIVIITCS